MPLQVELLEQRRERVVDHERPGARVAQDVLDLGAGEARVDRDQHAAGERHRVVRLEDRGRVRRQHRDAVAVLEAAIAQRVREAVAAFLELAVGDPPPVLVRDGDASGMEVGRALQEGDGCQLAAVDARHARTSTQR